MNKNLSWRIRRHINPKNRIADTRKATVRARLVKMSSMNPRCWNRTWSENGKVVMKHPRLKKVR
jgi:hypothetical protein